MMTVPEMFLILLALTGLWYASDSVWRLRRRQPERGANVFAVVLTAVVVVLVTVNLQASHPRDLVTKGIIVTSVAAATVLRLIARKRSAVQP
jgi:uncharacterized membrane protein